MIEATLYKKAGNGIRCTACARYCYLKNGVTGFCGIRQNIDEKLYLLSYGIASAAHVDPIEKKPLVHYHPASLVYSISTTGCNWMCKYCQNCDISQIRAITGIPLPPEKVVKEAIENGCNGIAYTYNEPTIFAEYAHDTGIIAHKYGLFNIFVSNGYETGEAVEYCSTFLDAITIDFKGNGNRDFLRKYAGVINADPIFETLKLYKKKGIHIEITDLIVPGCGDDLDDGKKLIEWIIDNLGDYVPVHLLRFHPDYKMMDTDITPVSILEEHYVMAKKLGLKYPYIGNVPGHKWESTYCHNCGKLIVERYGFDIVKWNVKNGHCPYCNVRIPITGGMNNTDTISE